jgi:hypothetical protein
VISYTPGASARDDVRLLIGDTDETVAPDVRLEDEDIDRLLVLTTGSASPGTSGIRRSAAEAADALAAKFARKAEGGPLSSTSRAQELRATARNLRASAVSAAAPSAGGISIASKADADADTDRVAPAFRKGMLSSPEGPDA